jgi:hypothetical protein
LHAIPGARLVPSSGSCCAPDERSAALRLRRRGRRSACAPALPPAPLRWAELPRLWPRLGAAARPDAGGRRRGPSWGTPAGVMPDVERDPAEHDNGADSDEGCVGAAQPSTRGGGGAGWGRRRPRSRRRGRSRRRRGRRRSGGRRRLSLRNRAKGACARTCGQRSPGQHQGNRSHRRGGASG